MVIAQRSIQKACTLVRSGCIRALRYSYYFNASLIPISKVSFFLSLISILESRFESTSPLSPTTRFFIAHFLFLRLDFMDSVRHVFIFLMQLLKLMLNPSNLLFPSAYKVFKFALMLSISYIINFSSFSLRVTKILSYSYSIFCLICKYLYLNNSVLPIHVYSA